MKIVYGKFRIVYYKSKIQIKNIDKNVFVNILSIKLKSKLFKI